MLGLLTTTQARLLFLPNSDAGVCASDTGTTTVQSSTSASMHAMKVRLGWIYKQGCRMSKAFLGSLCILSMRSGTSVQKVKAGLPAYACAAASKLADSEVPLHSQRLHLCALKHGVESCSTTAWLKKHLGLARSQHADVSTDDRGATTGQPSTSTSTSVPLIRQIGLKTMLKCSFLALRSPEILATSHLHSLHKSKKLHQPLNA